MTLWNPESDAALDFLFEEPSGDPVADLGRGLDLLRQVQRGERPGLLRFYRPDPTLAFGQRDVRMAGYEQAVAASTAHGFAPVVRKAGGRAAAYHRGTLIVDHIEPHSEAILGHQRRFEVFGELYAQALRQLGVQARVGAIPGEYCPGDFSVHGLPTELSRSAVPVKLVGTAQRVIAGAWLFSSVFVIEDSAPIRAVLDAVYQAMDLEMDPSTAGAADDMVPGVNVEDFIDALLSEYRQHTTVNELV
ncbi:lipoate--protein ligase family protein [Glutamicibacter endophyticus]|uniref:lipoate--protein ligase family protein n=1 Tax=Glutamicibacter endophyticus TaxID=1522174 RepID=UPI003AEF6A80